LTARTWLSAAALAVGVASAALWPLSAYAVHPIILPALLTLAFLTVVVLAWPEVGIAAALALAPLTNLTVGDPFGVKPFQLLLPALAFGLLLYASLVGHAGRELRREAWLSVATVLVVVVAAASSIQALEPSESVNDVMLILTAGAIFFAVLQICHERRQFVVVAGGALAGLLVAAVQGIGQHYSGAYSGYGFVAEGEVVPRVAGSFGHPNQYGGFVAFLLPRARAVGVSRAVSPRLRVLAAAAATAALPALMFSYVRGAIVGVVVGSILWLMLVRPRAALVSAVALAVAVVALAPATLKDRFTGESSSSGVVLRVDIWKSALAIYSDHPLLGAGLSNFSEAYSRLPPVLESAVQRRLLHQAEVLVPPHAQNLYLNILAEEGTVGALVFMLWAAGAIWAVYRGAQASDPTARMLSLGLGAGLATFAIHSLFEASLFGEIALPLFGLVAVAAVFGTRERERVPSA